MGLLQMSFYGAVMIMVVVLIRTAAFNRLPKRTFIILWSIVLIRLLIPFKITSDFSVYTLIGHDAVNMIGNQAAVGITEETEDRILEAPVNPVAVRSSETVHDGGESQREAADRGKVIMQPEEEMHIGTERRTLEAVLGSGNAHVSVWIWIYSIGTVFCAAFFIITYVRCCMAFGMSLPVSNDFISQWLEEHRKPVSELNAPSWREWMRSARFRPIVSVRMSDQIDTPLTYGVIHPVILLPKKTEWDQTAQLEYILRHEYTHICSGDSILKMVAAVTLSVHWFNPLVWMMYLLLNRDIELACDEHVVRTCGISDKSAYANMLINMEAKRSGVMPLCNNFSQNAIEERVRAIMKIRKISLGAVIFAAGLVVGVTTAFATTAPGFAADSTEKENDRHTDTQQQINWTQEEYDKLLALRLDGYEDMIVSEYQDRIWKLTDMVEYMELLDRYFQEETLPEVWDNSEAWEELTAQSHDDMTFYLNIVLQPLLNEQWEQQDFGGYVSVSEQYPPENVERDMAVLNYMITLTILDADKLTVGEYIDTRLEVNEEIKEIFAAGYSAEELADEEYMRLELYRAMYALTQRLSNDRLRVEVDYAFRPTDSLEAYMEEQEFYEEYFKERQEELEKVLKPYMPFGLTFEYDVQADEGRMYFEGREVRGIIDEEQGIWITEHSGIGVGIYAEDAIEVYAVYEDGELTGLRAATAKEQEEIDKQRRQSTNESKSVGVEEEEFREFPAGTAEDYVLMLSLKKPDYQQMSLADFNAALLEWANEHDDSYNRIECDSVWDDCRVNLSKEDKEFVTRTVNLSGCENAMYVRSEYTGETEEDVCLSGDLTKLPEGDEAAYAWCDLYYQFSYHVSDKEKVTVGERDRCVGGMLKGIEDFWEKTDIEELLQMEKTDIIENLTELAKKYSTKNITIEVMPEDQIGFECMDERALMEEQHGGAEGQKKNF